MGEIYVIYGDESQLVKDKELEILSFFPNHRKCSFNEESGPAAIGAALFEENLFVESRIFSLRNIPILKSTKKNESLSSVKKDKKVKNLGIWQLIYDNLLAYTGDSPIVLIYDGNLDKRVKSNQLLLEKSQVYAFSKLSLQEIKVWIETYVKTQGYRFTSEARLYLYDLLEMWQEVNLNFLKTEFERFFLLLGGKKEITAPFLIEHISDFAAKNIFLFKDALLKKDAKKLMELFPYILSTKEQERAFAYIESQLRLQYMVNECRAQKMSVGQITQFFSAQGSKVKSYPIQLAYEQGQVISQSDLGKLLQGLYEIVLTSRQGKDNTETFKDLCLAYCKVNR